MWSNATPASLILQINEDMTKMLPLFEDCIEFSEPASNGWDILRLVDSRLGKGELHYDILSMLLSLYRMEMTHYMDFSSLCVCLSYAIQRSDVKSVRLLLDIYPSAAEAIPHFPLDSPTIITATVEMIQLIINKGADIHRICFNETLTSVSLWFSRLFFQWRNRLEEIYGKFDDISSRETGPEYPLARIKWRSNTLGDLFSLEIGECSTPPFNRCVSCCCCTDDFSFFDCRMVEPWWEAIKHRVKTEICICSLLCQFDVGKRNSQMIEGRECAMQGEIISLHSCSSCRFYRILRFDGPHEDTTHCEESYGFSDGTGKFLFENEVYQWHRMAKQYRRWNVSIFRTVDGTENTGQENISALNV